MAEEKKDSFTFSDKIKSNKPVVASTSTLKRTSARVGTDGRPRITLYERTKRDAPFFIAALLALLLLPFLVKYTGTSSEDMSYLPSDFEAEMGLGGTGADELYGGIGGSAGLAPGGSSMQTLIDLLGSKEAGSETLTEEEINRTLPGGGDTLTGREDETTKKVYNEIHKMAPREARAAVARKPTFVDKLVGGRMASAGGSLKGGWGGIGADAARTGPGAPRVAAKPVSLQPLISGRSGRTISGDAAIAEAQRSLEAMNKGTALQSLMDSMMRPAEAGGGAFGLGGAMGSKGGGSGGGIFKNSSKGMMPWWWDLMKQRDQAIWEWQFELFKALATPLIYCLATGNHDKYEVDWAFSGGTDAKPKGGDKCCGYTKEKWEASPPHKDHPNFPEKKYCKEVLKCTWEGGNSELAETNFVEARLNCLGFKFGATGSKLAVNNCKVDLVRDDKGGIKEPRMLASNGITFITQTSHRDKGFLGIKFRKDWRYVYHYVTVGRYATFGDTTYKICDADNNPFKATNAGIGMMGRTVAYKDKDGNNVEKGVAAPTSNRGAKGYDAQYANATNKPSTDMTGYGRHLGDYGSSSASTEDKDRYNDDNPQEDCVIYIAQVDKSYGVFPGDDFHVKMLQLLQEKVPGCDMSDECFNKLVIKNVYGVAMTDPIANADGWSAKEAKKKENQVKEYYPDPIYDKPDGSNTAYVMVDNKRLANLMDLPVTNKNFLERYVFQQGNSAQRDTGTSDKRRAVFSGPEVCPIMAKPKSDKEGETDDKKKVSVSDSSAGAGAGAGASAGQRQQQKICISNNGGTVNCDDAFKTCCVVKQGNKKEKDDEGNMVDQFFATIRILTTKKGLSRSITYADVDKESVLSEVNEKCGEKLSDIEECRGGEGTKMPLCQDGSKYYKLNEDGSKGEFVGENLSSEMLKASVSNYKDGKCPTCGSGPSKLEGLSCKALLGNDSGAENASYLNTLRIRKDGICGHCYDFVHAYFTTKKMPTKEKDGYTIDDFILAVVDDKDSTNDSLVIDNVAVCKFMKMVMFEGKDADNTRNPKMYATGSYKTDNGLGLFVSHFMPSDIVSKQWIDDNMAFPYAKFFGLSSTLNLAGPEKGNKFHRMAYKNGTMTNSFYVKGDKECYTGGKIFKGINIGGSAEMSNIYAKQNGCDALKGRGTITMGEFKEYLRYLCKCGLDARPAGTWTGNISGGTGDDNSARNSKTKTGAC